MGDIVVTEFVSLDGVFEAPGGGDYEHAGWTFNFDRGTEGDTFKLAELTAADAQLLGRVTYDGFAAAWPSMTDEDGFADKMNAMPKYVVSSTLRDPAWQGSTVIDGDLAANVTDLKKRHDGDILVAGSGALVRELIRLHLVDEVRLMVFPIVLGTGQRLFDGTPLTRFTLTDHKPVGPDGVLVLTYRTATDDQQQPPT